MFFLPVKKSAIISLVLICGLTACSLGSSSTPTLESPTFTPEPPTATPLPAAATVNGELIPLVEYEAELARYQAAQTGLGRTVSDAEAADIVLEDMISQVLLAQGARAAGLTVTDQDVQSRIDALIMSLGSADKLSAWQSAHGYDDASFRSSLRRAAEAALMRDKIIAEVPGTIEQVHARQILFYNDADAQGVLVQLKSGASFDELAAIYDPVTRGELGWFPQGYLLDANVEAAAFALQPGQFSEVIASAVGFHIIYIIERGQHQLSPDALLALQEKALTDWVRQKRAQADIVLVP